MCAASLHAAPLSGRLAYVQNGAAYVMTLPNGRPQLLPNSRGARLVSLAPSGGTVLYVVPQKGGERAFTTRPPYKSARALPASLAKFEFSNVQWSADASKVLLASWEKNYLWQPASNSLRPLPGGDGVISRDAKMLAYATEKELRLRDLATGNERVLFSISKPQPLFDALKRAKYPKNLKELNDMVSPDMWKDTSNWNLGSQTFSADGKTLWFACNAGTSSGAAGNTTYCWFACDLSTGRLAALSKLGARFSRLPYTTELSPDGKKLLYVTSVHSSAIDNPCAVSVMDLLTQTSRDLLDWTENKQADSNLVYGTSWSPDSHAVAMSALFYELNTVMKTENWEPRNSAYTLYIRDLKGHTVKTMRGAVLPSWGR